MTQSFNPVEIKALVFDVGGVLALDAPRYFLSELAVRESLDVEDLVRMWKKNLGQLITGKISEDQFWLLFIDDLNLKIPQDELLVRFKKEIRLFLLLDKGLLGYLRSLKDELNAHCMEPVKFAILSNNVKEWAKELERQADLGELFEVIMYSCDEGLAKPDPSLFQKVCIKLDAGPSHIMFIDNREKNLRQAKEIGMHPILFSTPDEFKAAMTVAHISKPVQKEV